MNLSISEAAELVGIDRKTIYKHIAKGRLSAGVNTEGQKVIQAAELHRVYGDFAPPEATPATTGDSERRQPATPAATIGDILSELVKEVKALREENSVQAEQLAAIRQELAERPRLENKSPRPPTSRWSEKAAVRRILAKCGGWNPDSQP